MDNGMARRLMNGVAFEGWQRIASLSVGAWLVMGSGAAWGQAPAPTGTPVPPRQVESAAPRSASVPAVSEVAAEDGATRWDPSPSTGQPFPPGQDASTANAVWLIYPEPADGKLRVRVGKKSELVLLASGEQGERLTLSVAGLPAHAVYDGATGKVIWEPRIDDIGPHALQLTARGTGVESRQTLLVFVEKNTPPEISTQPLSLTVSDNYPTPGTTVGVVDKEGDAVTVEVHGLPEGIRFDPTTRTLSADVDEEPEEGTYTLTVRATDGELVSERQVPLGVHEQDSHEKEWESFLMPGAGYAVQRTGDKDALGYLMGPSIEILIAAWIHSNHNRGPSHGRVYTKAELLRASGSSDALGLAYSLGFDLSLEREPNRGWLVPHYGVEFGGIAQEDMGHKFQVLPYVGVHVWSSQNIFVQLRGGYRIVPAELDDYSGWHAGGVVDFSTW